MHKLAALALAVSACSHAEKRESTPSPPPTPAASSATTSVAAVAAAVSQEPYMSSTKDPVALSWKMKLVDKAMEISYRVDNHTDKRVYVCDQLTIMVKQNVWRKFPAVSMQNAPDQPGTVQIVVGTPSTDVPSFTKPPVTYVPIEPGQFLEATRSVPLPFKSYNPMGMTRPLDSPTKAFLVVYSFEGEPPSWKELTGEDGQPIKVPEGFGPKNLKSDTLPLP